MDGPIPHQTMVHCPGGALASSSLYKAVPTPKVSSLNSLIYTPLYMQSPKSCDPLFTPTANHFRNQRPYRISVCWKASSCKSVTSEAYYLSIPMASEQFKLFPFDIVIMS